MAVGRKCDCVMRRILCYCEPGKQLLDYENEKKERDGRVKEYGSGVRRTEDAGKPDYTLIYWEGIDRWAEHMTKAVATHGHNNWRKAHTADDFLRFRQSFWRHVRQWERGDNDEDHYAAMLYNASGVEYVKPILAGLRDIEIPRREWEL